MKQFKWQLINMEAASKLTPNLIEKLSRAETATFFDETKGENCKLVVNIGKRSNDEKFNIM